MNLTAFRDWFWAGTPERRLIVHLVISLVVIAIPLGAFGGQTKMLLVLFVGWDLGAWYMDKLYIARRAAQKPAAAQ